MTKKEKQFVEEFVALCKKHGLALVPTYEMDVSFHDPMAVIPLNDATEDFITRRTLSREDLK